MMNDFMMGIPSEGGSQLLQEYAAKPMPKMARAGRSNHFRLGANAGKGAGEAEAGAGGVEELALLAV